MTRLSKPDFPEPLVLGGLSFIVLVCPGAKRGLVLLDIVAAPRYSIMP
jgi:hypothetical protein